MREADLTGLSLSEAAQKIARREVSPLELTEACIERAERLDPLLNAYFTKTFDLALAQARDATAEIAAGRQQSPLHGVPFALKDLYETAGIRTTAGARLRDSYVPAEDAHVVTMLKQAGIVLLGKLNMHEWALGGTNINEHYPSPRNPWDTDRITGGSSGGSAAALAAGLCLGSLGSDTRGSIRIPAALCGITGLKPTYGRVSLRGVVPLNWSLDHAGPMARTAADCALILQAIAGYDSADPLSVDEPVPDYSVALRSDLRGVRIGVPREFFFDGTVLEAEVIAAVQATREVFRSLGAEVRDVSLPDIEALSADGGAFLADAAAYHETNLREYPELYGSNVRSRLQAALSIPAAAYSRARLRQFELKRSLAGTFADIDLLLTPTTPVVAFAFPDDPTSVPPTLLTRNTGPFNVAGNPAISVPCGFTAEGMPIGLSLAGRWWEEGLVLGAAHAYQQVTDWHKRAPDLG
ncbi:MAG: amidase [Dehalococcoidia bacterium]|nr:amidase [Dehalococcoidia bacterium]